MTDDEIVIGNRSQPFFELTPYYFNTFSVDGKKWRTLIHYWVAMYFREDTMQNYIRNLDTPQIAINVASKHGFKDFNDVDSKFIIRGLQARYNQNDQLRMILLSTGSATIIYGNGGTFLSKDNRYGKLLMRIREMYQC